MQIMQNVKDVAARGTKITLPLKAYDFLQQYYIFKLFYIWQALLSKENFFKRICVANTLYYTSLRNSSRKN